MLQANHAPGLRATGGGKELDMNARTFVTAILAVVLTVNVCAQDPKIPLSGAENVICNGLTGLIIWDVMVTPISIQLI